MGVIMDEPAKPAGYVRERPVYRLVFDDPTMAGLTIRVRALSFGDAYHLDDRILADEPGQGIDLDKLAKEFFRAEVFVDWNLQQPDGAPVPGTVDSLYALDRPFVRAVLLGWLRSISEVPAPLDGPSSGGEPSLEESSIPMDPLSPNLES